MLSFFPQLRSRGSDAASLLTIDLSAIAHNYDLICGMVAPGCEVSAVVKADSYGLGMDKVAAVLENRNVKSYVVATPDEALALRKLTRRPVLSLSGVSLGAADDFVRANITPALNSLADVALWRDMAARAGVRLPAALHFDTGMNRLGLAGVESAQLRTDHGLLDGIDVRVVMSHFACADEDHPMNARQFAAFRDIAAQFPDAKKSICNSSGLFRSTEWHLDMVRPGQALYGLNPAPGKKSPLRPVVSLDARLLQVKTVPAGETVGYGASYKFEHETIVGTLALGYADGFFRALGNNGSVYFKNCKCAVIGRVSMDLVTVAIDAGLAPGVGDMVEILGPNQSADDLAQSAGTIGYEILTALGRRYVRTYKSA